MIVANRVEGSLPLTRKDPREEERFRISIISLYALEDFLIGKRHVAVLEQITVSELIVVASKGLVSTGWGAEERASSQNNKKYEYE